MAWATPLGEAQSTAATKVGLAAVTYTSWTFAGCYTEILLKL